MAEIELIHELYAHIVIIDQNLTTFFQPQYIIWKGR